MKTLGGYLAASVTAVLASAVLMAFSGVAAAQPTLVGTPDDATGIDGLVVAGKLYDVTFSQASYNTLFTGDAPPPLFLNDSDMVFATESPLNNFLSSAGVTGILGGSCLSDGCRVFVPFGTTSNAFATYAAGAGTGGGPDGWANFAGGGPLVTDPAGGPGQVYAVFVPAAAHGAPEIDPEGEIPALTLLIGMLCLIRQRRQRVPARDAL